MYTPTVNSYFSGGGLLDHGLLDGGLNVQQSLEIESKSCETHRRNFEHEVLQEDIALTTVCDQEDADVIVGTYPCTKYSAIADIHGARTGDELFLHFFRHIAIKKPEAFVVENVPGMKKFPVVMEAMTQLPDYYVKTFCPVEATNWLPQKRKRLIIIGTKRHNNISEPSPSKRPTLKDILEDYPDYTFNDSMEARVLGKYRDLPKILDPENSNEIALTCVAHYAKDRGTSLIKCEPSKRNRNYGLRPFTVREYARLQGLPDSFEFPVADSHAFRQIGNGVPVPVGQWIAKELLKYFN